MLTAEAGIISGAFEGADVVGNSEVQMPAGESKLWLVAGSTRVG